MTTLEKSQVRSVADMDLQRLRAALTWVLGAESGKPSSREAALKRLRREMGARMITDAEVLKALGLGQPLPGEEPGGEPAAAEPAPRPEAEPAAETSRRAAKGRQDAQGAEDAGERRQACRGAF
jgi:hypothetical protein